MRIHYASHALVPSREANSLQVMKMCAAWARAGHEVTLACRRGSEAGDAHAFYGLAPDFALQPVVGGNVRVVRRLLYSWRAAAVARGPAELLFGRDYHTLALVALRGLGRAPIVLEVHQPPTSALERRILGRLLASPRLALLVAISEALAEEYRVQHPELRAPILVAPDGADAPAAPLPTTRAPGPIRLGYVGSLFPGKGLEWIERLAARLPEAAFHVLGGTSADLEYWRARLTLPNVRFHGHVPHAEAQVRMREFDLLLAPYRPAVLIGGGASDVGRWMSPLKVFEYMASGRPLVASDLPVLREVLVDGVNARLVPPDDLEAWVTAIEELVRAPSSARALAERAREDLLGRFTWDVRARRILEALALPRRVEQEVRA
jgi:glycosyltransferase involved in cell wall biosynthesis